MQDIARLKHRMPHPRNELRCTLFQKVAKYHGVSVGVAIIQRGYIRMRIDPDDSNVLVFPVQVIEEVSDAIQLPPTVTTLSGFSAVSFLCAS